MNAMDKKNDILSIFIIFSGLAALSAVFFEWASPLRTFLVLVFLLTCPGAAYVQMFNIRDGVSFFTLSVALSL